MLGGGDGKSVKGRKRCSGIYTCQVLEENMEIKSTQTRERSKIRQDIDCKCDIIYLVTCKKMWASRGRIMYKTVTKSFK